MRGTTPQGPSRRDVRADPAAMNCCELRGSRATQQPNQCTPGTITTYMLGLCTHNPSETLPAGKFLR
jgi:hypothetical protein